MKEARKNSVSHLADLYNVIIGVALTLAVNNIIDTSAQGLPLRIGIAVNLLAFLVLVIPFYHGAVRHLFATYVENGGSTRIKSGALLADFVLLFVEGCLFVMIALLIGATEKMAWATVALLVLDSVWGFLAWLAFTGAHAQFAEKRWALINCVTAVAVSVLLIFGEQTFHNNLRMAQWGIVAVLTLRTIIDYVSCWDFYFPEA